MSVEGSETSGASITGENDPMIFKDAMDPFDYFDFGSFHEPVLWDEGYIFGSKSSSGYDEQFSELNVFAAEEWIGEWNRFYSREQEEGEKDEILSSHRGSLEKNVKKSKTTESTTQEQRRRSLFVHSSPINFPDINRVRKSAFGSIFLRTMGNVLMEEALLKTVADSTYIMLHSLLASLDKIILSPDTDEDRRLKAMQNRESLLRSLEFHGISKAYSDGNVLWNIYPITHNYLFSLQIGANLHETRYLSEIENRILSGPVQNQRLPYEWPTDSVWTGCWDALGMGGPGTYIMPHGVLYNGLMQDGLFHDADAMLTYPNQFKALHCVYKNGVLQDCQFQFPDLLMHEKENWMYCKFPDRRFWSEVRRGLKPAKIAQKTEEDPPRFVPKNCYDTGDGFYDPVSRMLVNENGQLLRVPVCSEDHWIKKYCRSEFFEYANFRPDLFENWFDHNEEIIQSILTQQDNYRRRKITYEDLQQFYADLELLPRWSKYKKRKSPSEIAMEEHLNSIPTPQKLRKPKKINKYFGHKILTSSGEEDLHSESEKVEEKKGGVKSISLRYNEGNSLTVYSSKYTGSGIKSILHKKREIPEKYLKYQPVLRQAFESAKEWLPHDPEPETPPRRCLPRRSSYSSSSSSSSYGGLMRGEGNSSKFTIWERKSMEKYFKRLIMDRVNSFLEKERQRHIKRLQWAKPPPKPKAHTKELNKSEKCMKVLQELFNSIPEKYEYCDSDPKKTCDFKALAEDKFDTIQYWGTRMYKLDFEETQPI